MQKCPLCGLVLVSPDLPKKLSIMTCHNCKEIYQVLPSGDLVPLGAALELSAAGDDRLAGLSPARLTTMRSFLEVLASGHQRLQADTGIWVGQLRAMLSRAEDRLDFAISELAGDALVSDKAQRVVDALQAVREIISTLPKASRGLPRGAS